MTALDWIFTVIGSLAILGAVAAALWASYHRDPPDGP